MDLIKVVVFPYSSEPVVQEIENNRYSFMQRVEGKIDDISLGKDYRLIMSRTTDEDFKLQEEYGIYGNFIVVKRAKDKIVSMTDEEAEYIIKNTKELLKAE